MALLSFAGCRGDSTYVAPTTGLVPLESLMGNPGTSAPVASPDGKAIAMVMPAGLPGSQRMNVFVQGTGSGADRVPPKQITFETERDVRQLRWLSANRVGYLIDPKGDENNRLWAVDKDGSNLRELTPRDLQNLDSFPVCPDPAGASRWLVAMGPAHRHKDLYWIDVETGAHGLKERNTEHLLYVVPDRNNRILLGLAHEGLHLALKYRPSEGEPWRTLTTATHPDMILPVAMDGPGQAKVLANLGRDTVALFQYDLHTGTLGALIKAVSGRDLEMPDLDGDLAHLPDSAHALLRGSRPGIHAHHPGGSAPETRIVRFTARDGLALWGYLTLPSGGRDPHAPAIIHCHGGPEVMTPINDPEVRFLASRGIVVLQPHFRGSGGTGKAFEAMGHGQWGRAMQDDLTDSARWLADQGYADPRRIGIMGGSYGGFAALAGAALTPDVFCCAVARNGPSSLLTMLASPMMQAQPELSRLRIGDPVRDEAGLRAASPLHNAHRVRIPVLIGQGAQDSRVPRSESDQMVRALRARGLHVPYLVLENEGHSYWMLENRLTWYRAVENFLGLHLGSQVEAPSGFPVQ